MKSLLRGIGWRIFISFTTLLVVLLIVLAIAGWKYLESTAFDNASNELRVQSITLVQQLQRDLTRIENTVRVMGSDGGRLDDFISNYDVRPGKLKNYLAKRLSQTSLFEAFTVYDVYGRLVASTDSDWSTKSVGDQGFFTAGLKKVSYSEVFEDPRYAEIVLLVAGPIGEPKLPRGVMVGKIRLSQLYELMGKNLGVSGAAEAFLVDSKLRFVTPAKTAPADEILQSHLASTPLINHLKDEFWVGRYHNYKGVEVLGTVRKTVGYDGFLVIEKEYKDVEKHLNFLRRTMMAALAFLMTAVTLTSVLITRTITKPVQSLVQSAQNIAAGNLSDPVQVPSGADEISYLANEFDKMRVQLALYQSQLRERLEESEQKRIESERLAAIGTLAASLAHEIRNPLNGISLLLSRLERSSQNETRDRAPLDGIRAEIVRLDRLVTDILDYARPLQLQRGEFDIAQLLRDLLQFYAPVFEERGIVVQSRVPDTPVTVRADSDKLRQALMNVIQNAMEATTGRGLPLIIGCDVSSRKTVMISVIDSGGGINEQIKSQVFDLFFSTKDKGNGLGLGTVRKIMEAHGGSVEIFSQVGRGATVRLILPKE